MTETTDKKRKPKVHRCFNCGVELQGTGYHDRRDTCGALECDREARADYQAEREEAHERLDRDMGWDRY